MVTAKVIFCWYNVFFSGSTVLPTYLEIFNNDTSETLSSFPSTPTSTIPNSDFSKLIPSAIDNASSSTGRDVDLGVSPLVCCLLCVILFIICWSYLLIGLPGWFSLWLIDGFNSHMMLFVSGSTVLDVFRFWMSFHLVSGLSPCMGPV